MPFISGNAEKPLDFDAVIAAIGRLHPGTQVTVPDYYASRISRATEHALKQGNSGPNPALECLKRVGVERGLQRQIDVPIRHDVSLTGRVYSLGCLFTGTGFSNDDVGPLVDLLAKAGFLVEVDTNE